MKTGYIVLKIGSFMRKYYQTELPSTIYILKFAACFLEIAGNSIYMLFLSDIYLDIGLFRKLGLSIFMTRTKIILCWHIFHWTYHSFIDINAIIVIYSSFYFNFLSPVSFGDLFSDSKHTLFVQLNGE